MPIYRHTTRHLHHVQLQKLIVLNTQAEPTNISIYIGAWSMIPNELLAGPRVSVAIDRYTQEYTSQ